MRLPAGAGVLFVIFLAACESPDALLRDHPLDPESAQFVPVAPSAFSATPSPGIVTLEWVGGSSHADSVLIEKAVSGDAPFERLAMIAGSERSYVDDTGLLTPTTRYQMTLLTFRDATRPSESRTASLTPGQITSFNLESAYPDSLFVTWETTPTFATHARIAAEVDDVFREIARFPLEQGGAMVAVVLDGLNDIRYQVRLVADLPGEELTLADKNATLKGATFCAPTDLAHEFVDEETVTLTWVNRCPLDVQFRADQIWSHYAFFSQTFPVGSEQGTYHAQFANGNAYRIRLHAVLDGRLSDATFTDLFHYQIEPPHVEISSIDGNRLHLSWTHNSDLAAGYIVKRADGNISSFREVARLSASERTYVDELDPAMGRYRYQVSSLSSYYSSADVVYQNELVEDLRIEMEEGESELLGISETGEMIATAGVAGGQSVLHVHAASNGTPVVNVTGLRGKPVSVAVSETTGMVAVSIEHEGVDIYTFAGTLSRSIRVHEPSGIAFSPGGDHLAVVSANGALSVFDTSNWRTPIARHSYAYFTSRPRGVTFSPDGRTVVWPRDNESMHRVDLDTRQDLTSIVTGFWADRPAFSSDGTRFLGGSTLFDTATFTSVYSAPQLEGADVNSDGGLLAGLRRYSGTRGEVLQVIDVNTDRVIAEPSVRQLRVVRFLPDDRMALAMGLGRVRIMRIGEPRWLEN